MTRFERFDLLLTCYRSGQMLESEWQAHLREEPGLRAFVEGAARRAAGLAIDAAIGVLEAQIEALKAERFKAVKEELCSAIESAKTQAPEEIERLRSRLVFHQIWGCE